MVRSLLGVIAQLTCEGKALVILLHPLVATELPLVTVAIHHCSLAVLHLLNVLKVHLLGLWISDDPLIDRLLKLPLLIWVRAGVMDVVQPWDSEATGLGCIHGLPHGFLLLGLS